MFYTWELILLSFLAGYICSLMITAAIDYIMYRINLKLKLKNEKNLYD
jgi:hypothetical protein